MIRINFAVLLPAFLIVAEVHAQSKLKKGVIKAKTETFVVTNSGDEFFIGVTNVTNPSTKLEPKNLVKLSGYKLKDPTSVQTVFKKVFTKQRLTELLPEINMVLTYHIDGHGAINFLEFAIRKNTVLTPIELEVLEKTLKYEVVFIVPINSSNGVFWPITQVIQFKKLLTK